VSEGETITKLRFHVEARANGSRVAIKTELRPKGLLALVLPVMRRTLHERENQNLERVKAVLEARGS